MQRMTADEYRRFMDARKTERDIQREIVAYLQAVGYVEPRVVVNLEKCVGHELGWKDLEGLGILGLRLVYGGSRRSADYQGTMQTTGIPDLEICPLWGHIWLKMEIKSIKGKLTPEQEIALRPSGIVVRSVEHVKTAVETIEKSRPK